MLQESTGRDRDEKPSLFKDALHLVAEKFSQEALAWLHTIHQQHPFECPAHQRGEACCVDVLLEATSPLLPSRSILPLAEIIRAGYDVIIESATDDRNGELHIYLTHQDQEPKADSLQLAATPATLDRAFKKARDYAVAFPLEVH